ncbi:vWA domain-containing protein [Vibrio sonorensis]|uniref:vWA domain-containing protein n=1 Tax=Vibrio sonorensis TaxID=1004316 RepID=UPI0008DA1A9F|nr:VWA domain-containing protein [Vibrio sonorensis]
MPDFTFVWWWAFFLIPLPLLAYFLLPAEKSDQALYLPYLPDEEVNHPPSNKLPRVLAIIVWLGLIAAIARPVSYGDPIIEPTMHRDMMLVVDLSGSMAQEDMKVGDDYTDRLTAVKKVVGDFISERQGDRLGLVLFADHAYLQTPLTTDLNAVSAQLNRTVLELIGSRTAIGEGIGLATKTFIDSDAPQRVMILLSDGSNTSGVLEPLEAAKIASEHGTTIYTVGLGAGEMQVRSFFSTRTVNTAKDLDEKTLTAIAEMTGGQYFRARDPQQLEQIYQTINQLEPISKSTQVWRPRFEWFYWPLSISFISVLILVIVRRNNG